DLCLPFDVHSLFLPVIFFVLYRLGQHRHLRSFPTRRSSDLLPPTRARTGACGKRDGRRRPRSGDRALVPAATGGGACAQRHQRRSEEHTSELQSRENLVCRLLLEKKNKESEREQIWELRRTV